MQHARTPSERSGQSARSAGNDHEGHRQPTPLPTNQPLSAHTHTHTHTLALAPHIVPIGTLTSDTGADTTITERAHVERSAQRPAWVHCRERVLGVGDVHADVRTCTVMSMRRVARACSSMFRCAAWCAAWCAGMGDARARWSGKWNRVESGKKARPLTCPIRKSACPVPQGRVPGPRRVVTYKQQSTW
jgi:hypothetical protein